MDNMIKNGVFVLMIFFSILLPAQQSDFLTELKKCKHNVSAVDIRSRMNKMDSCYIGLAIPKFKTKSIKGDAIDLSTMGGKVVVINIWSLWCGPCIAEIPGLNDIADKYKGQNVVFLALTNEKSESINKFLNSGNEFKFQIVPDSKNIFYRQLDSFGFPRTMIIDKHGIIRTCFSGGFNSKASIEEIKKKLIPDIDRFLKEE